jgi:xylan 1,4-beta-xylosidase
MHDRAKLVRERARERPVYFTEWNISSNPRDHYHDEPFAAAYAARIALEADPFVDGCSFWTFTDIFDENYFPSIPFHGGFGLLTLHGIPKPVYRAFQLLHGLGDERLPVAGTHETVDAWVVRKGRSITVFLTNYAQPRHEIVTQLVEVSLTDAPAPIAVYIERIDEAHANPRRRWREMGEPEYPSRSQVEQLEVASRLVKEPFDVAYADRTIRFDIELPPHSVAAVTLELAT